MKDLRSRFSQKEQSRTKRTTRSGGAYDGQESAQAARDDIEHALNVKNAALEELQSEFSNLGRSRANLQDNCQSERASGTSQKRTGQETTVGTP
jgi:conjugal transfer/entry exclusion protein